MRYDQKCKKYLREHHTSLQVTWTLSPLRSVYSGGCYRSRLGKPALHANLWNKFLLNYSEFMSINYNKSNHSCFVTNLIHFLHTFHSCLINQSTCFSWNQQKYLIMKHITSIECKLPAIFIKKKFNFLKSMWSTKWFSAYTLLV